MSQNLNKFKKPVLIFIIAAAVIVTWMLFFNIGTTKSEAMSPSCPKGSTYVAVMRLLPISRGQIIVYTSKTDYSLAYFSRIAGVPGDKIRVVNKNFYINDHLVAPASTYIFPVKMWLDLEALGWDLVIPNGKYFILADNQTHTDSRDQYLIEKSRIIGQVLFCK